MNILCFDVTYVGFGPCEWKRLALSGMKLQAIKSLRDKSNKSYPSPDDSRRLGLRQALEIVNRYMDKHKVTVRG